MSKTPLTSSSDREEWQIGHIPPSISLILLAALVGFAAGFLAFVLKTIIKWLSTFLVGHVHPDDVNFGLLVLPVIGILLAVTFQKWIIGRNLEHGTEKVETAVKNKHYKLPFSDTYGPMIASTFTLGFGGSAGAEGPIATAGAAIASNLGQKFRLPPGLLRILVACGAGAGIAGIFKAPIGGVMFTLEVMGMELTTLPVIALVIACVIGGMTSYGFTGFTLDVPLTHAQHFDPSMSGWVIILGIFCGLYSLYYSWIATYMRRLFERVGSIWLRGLASGAVVAILVFLFPALYGEGYGVMALLIDGDTHAIVSNSFFDNGGAPSLSMLLIFCGGMALVKSAAATSSNSGGGVAGDFAPTLFAGCMAGYFFATGLNSLFGLTIPAENFALIGMAGAMAGIIRAPLMAMFIVIETTGYYGMMFPVVLATAFSYATVIYLKPDKK